MFRAVSVWVIQASKKKKRFSHLLGFVESRLSPAQRYPLGIPIKSKNRKRAGGRWEKGKGGSRPLFSLPLSHRAPRAFFFLVPHPHVSGYLENGDFFSPFSKKYESTKRIRIVFAHPSFLSPEPLGLICNEPLVSRPRDQETTDSGEENRDFKQ